MRVPLCAVSGPCEWGVFAWVPRLQGWLTNSSMVHLGPGVRASRRSPVRTPARPTFHRAGAPERHRRPCRHRLQRLPGHWHQRRARSVWTVVTAFERDRPAGSPAHSVQDLVQRRLAGLGHQAGAQVLLQRLVRGGGPLAQHSVGALGDISDLNAGHSAVVPCAPHRNALLLGISEARTRSISLRHGAASEPRTSSVGVPWALWTTLRTHSEPRRSSRRA